MKITIKEMLELHELIKANYQPEVYLPPKSVGGDPGEGELEKLRKEVLVLRALMCLSPEMRFVCDKRKYDALMDAYQAAKLYAFDCDATYEPFKEAITKAREVLG